jgi:hypothetical protein
MEMKTALLINEDLQAINLCQNLPAQWQIMPYYDEENNAAVCYEIAIGTEATFVRILFFRTLLPSGTIDHHIEVLQFATPPAFHGEAHLRKVFHSWTTFGLSYKSTIYRVLRQSVLFLRAIEAEALLRSGTKICPPGLFVIHNTRAENVKSILDSGGLSLKYARSGNAIWTRPPSYSRLEDTRFTGRVSLVINAEGLALRSADSYAVVIDDDIPMERVIRVCDIDEKTD